MGRRVGPDHGNPEGSLDNDRGVLALGLLGARDYLCLLFLHAFLPELIEGHGGHSLGAETHLCAAPTLTAPVSVSLTPPVELSMPGYATSPQSSPVF